MSFLSLPFIEQHAAICQGLPLEQYKEFLKESGISASDLKEHCGLPQLTGRKKPLTAEDSDILFRLMVVVRHLTTDKSMSLAAARQWLFAANTLLKGMSPAQLLQTHQGYNFAMVAASRIA